MIISLIVIAGVLAIAYMWASKGFLSSLLHMACVLAAGGIALAVWEPLAYMLLETGNRWVIDSAWGMALAGPFVVSLLVLRITLDKLVPGNVDLDTATNLIGGGICGLVSGTVTMGLVVLTVGMMRLAPSLSDYKAVEYQGGALVRTSSLWYPVDQLTANFYGLMSESTYKPFGTTETFAKWHPDFADLGAMMRTNYNNGFSFHTIEPDAFSVTSRYTVGRNENIKDITTDEKDEAKQSVIDPRGEAVVGNVYIEGFVVQFGPKAREKSGRVVVGTGQMRLIVEDQQGKTKAYHPFAVISQAQPKTEEGARDRGPEYGRWRYNANDVFIGSVGGQSDTAMAFEFLLPKGVKPIALYVKGVRHELGGGAGANFTSLQERDNKIESGELLAGALAKVDPATLKFEKAVRYNTANVQGLASITVSSMLPLNMVLQKDTLHGLSINDKKAITDGDALFTAQEMQTKVYERSLQVRELASTDDTAIVHVRVDGKNADFGLLSAAASLIDPEQAPVLIDTNNLLYTPVGFVYKTSTTTQIYYRPSQPITAVKDLPSLSISNPEREMILLYRVTRNAKIKHFAVGDQVLGDFRPPVETKPR